MPKPAPLKRSGSQLSNITGFVSWDGQYNKIWKISEIIWRLTVFNRLSTLAFVCPLSMVPTQLVDSAWILLPIFAIALPIWINFQIVLRKPFWWSVLGWRIRILNMISLAHWGFCFQKKNCESIYRNIYSKHVYFLSKTAHNFSNRAHFSIICV